MKNSTDKRNSKKNNNLRIKNGSDDKKQLESLIFTSVSIGNPRSSNC